MTCSYLIIKVQKVIYHCILCNHLSSEVSLTCCRAYYKAIVFNWMNIKEQRNQLLPKQSVHSKSDVNILKCDLFFYNVIKQHLVLC